MMDRSHPISSAGPDRIVVAALRNSVTGAVEALVNPDADWSPRKVNDVVDDILAGRHTYVLGPPAQQVELRVCAAGKGHI